MSASVSHWFSALGGDAGMPAARPPLDGDRRVDVCIVGGGYTGLWTAYELRRTHPELEVLVVEREVCGFGASGRNGGWVQGALAGDPSTWTGRGDPEGARRMRAAIRSTVGEIASVVQAEGIACDLLVGGTLTIARSAVELDRLRELEHAARRDGLWDEGEDALLGPDEVAARVRIPGAVGALFDPACARVQPAALARGLADAVERAGATIVEGTAVTAIEPIRGTVPAVARTDHGDVHARWVVRATEGYTPELPGERRTLAPITSSMIVTEPLGAERWAQVGWDGAETILDAGPLYHYLQRTADGRIAIGGRGVPYRYGSRTDREGPVPASTVATLRDGLVRLFGPALTDVAVDDAWHGVLGVARDWTPFVTADSATGVASAGGYVGEGVAASNLAGRTLRDLLVGRRSDLAALPWVLPPGGRPPRWEPEPLRWAGVRGVYGLLGLGQEIERRTGRPSRVTALAERISGH
ncbi:FAD-binding oxidoreductase [Patulibacter sp.]|uniref:NAD(P)/FAD-dependent oxidoreductase n=1 Tax=Patulibacter sp. TaxID=1912859 RepID=UPI0027184B0A|nr:FAD-binding oxidoreductase [Patulibacter sp.]MDO9409564.1 FAD-binding oxidoreductase [Patulibacter sp.]